MPRDKVSIILPTYNGARYLGRSIESCLAQTYPDIELIIVDDGSTDSTSEIINSYRDKRIQYIKNPTNCGLPRSLNTGFSYARGEYLTWTSDDNFYVENAIEKMHDFLKEKKAEFVYCDYYAFKENDPSETEIVRLPDKADFGKFNCVRACFLYSQQVKERTGEYDVEAELVEDYDYWIRVARNFSLLHLAEPFYYYRFHSNSLYSKRILEVAVAKSLLRLKYGFIDKRQFNDECLYLLLSRAKESSWLARRLTGVYYARKINLIATAFKRGPLNFSEAKSSLVYLVERPCRKCA